MPGSVSELEQFTHTLLSLCTFEQSRGEVVCGVSGGADSVALLWLAKQAGLNPTAAHVDHGIRQASEAEFVAEVANKFGCGFVSHKAEVVDGSDLEQRARIERHRLLGPGALLGHTMDDQAETVLINLLRGAGPSGLSGMTDKAKHPILGLRRSETEKLCELLDVDYFVDPSNQDSRFLRNRVRRELIPLGSDIASRDIVPLLARTAEMSAQTSAFVTELASGVDPTDTRALTQHHELLQQTSIREWLRDELGHPPSSAEVERVLQVARHEVLACEISGNRRIARTDGVLRVERG